MMPLWTEQNNYYSLLVGAKKEYSEIHVQRDISYPINIDVDHPVSSPDFVLPFAVRIIQLGLNV